MQVIDDTRKNVDGTSGRLRLGLVAYRDLWNGHDLPEVNNTYYIALEDWGGGWLPFRYERVTTTHH